MASAAIPTQNKYNDPYQQKNTDYGSIYRQKSLSRAANDILKMFGDNIVLNGLDVTPSFIGPTAVLDLTSGILIHDSTLVELNSSSLTCDVTAVGDTTTHNCYLAIFTDFQYVETPDADSQTELKLSVYHISPGGTATAFSGSPAFSTTRNKVLITILQFTKVGSNITAISEVPLALAGGSSPSILVSGETYYIKGITEDNINFWGVYENYSMGEFLSEFLFHDYTC